MNHNESKTEESNKLLQLLGVGFGIAVTIGGTIGTGILRKPGPIAAQLGDPSLIILVWILVSIYAFLGVLCTIELGVSIPRAGAWYVYARRAFGDYVGFVTGITSWLGTVAALGFGAYTMSEYIALIWPETDAWIRSMAIAILFLLMGFHWLGTKSAGKSQEIMSFLKAIGLVLFVGVCFWFGGETTMQELQQTTIRVTAPALFTGLIVALQQVFYTFDGWHTAAYFTEENTDPVNNLPKSMITGVLVVISIYLLVNLAILYIMPIEVLSHSKLAAADAIQMIFGAKSAKIITFFLMISILGMLNAQIMFAPRVIYSMSKDSLFFKAARRVNKGGTPAFAMPLTGILSILLIISGKDTCERLSDIAVFFFVLTYAAGFASVIRLRIKEPNLSRPYRVIAYPFVPILLIIVSLFFLVGAVVQDIHSTQYALVFLLISYPLYKAGKKWLF